MRQSVGCAVMANLAAGALSLSVSARAADDVCTIYKQHVPKDMGLALDKAVSVTREFCQAFSADNKDTVLLRVMKTGNAQAAVAGTRQSKVNSGNAATADEASLGAGAWSARTKDSIEISFGAKGQYVVVMMKRGAGLTDADVAKARDFAKAIAKSL